MEISPSDVVQMKEEIREELKAELLEELDTRGRTRRDVLKLGGAALGGAALGSVGGAAGAVGPGDETLDVGGVTTNTYRVADNWYGGPSGAQSELVGELGSADAGARFGADDTGEWFYWNGASWDLLPGTGGIENFGGTWVIHPPTTIDLAANLNDILGMGYSNIVVNKPEDGSIYTYEEPVSINGPSFNGVELDIREGVEINGGVEDWWITYQGSTAGDQRKTFTLDATEVEIEFTGNQSATPGCPGFARIIDTNQPYVDVNLRDFVNGDGDSTGVLFENAGIWTEGWQVTGDFRNVDRGVDFQDTGGFPSFVDGRFEDFSVGSNDFGVRLNGAHTGNVFDSCAFFYSADGNRGVVFGSDTSAGDAFTDQCRVQDILFYNCRWDDTETPFPNSIGLEFVNPFTGEGYPIMIGHRFNQVANEVVKAGASQDLYILDTDVAGLQIRESTGGGTLFRRNGRVDILDDAGDAVFQFNPATFTVSSTESTVNFDPTLRVLDGIRQVEGGDGFIGNNEFRFYMSDGTDGNTQGDIVVEVDVGGTELSEVISQRSNQT